LKNHNGLNLNVTEPLSVEIGVFSKSLET